MSHNACYSCIWLTMPLDQATFYLSNLFFYFLLQHLTLQLSLTFNGAYVLLPLGFNTLLFRYGHSSSSPSLTANLILAIEFLLYSRTSKCFTYKISFNFHHCLKKMSLSFLDFFVS